MSNAGTMAPCLHNQPHLNWDGVPRRAGAGYLDDYANLLDALLTLLEVQWQGRYLTFAQALADALLHNFYDTEHGGFFFHRLTIRTR